MLPWQIMAFLPTLGLKHADEPNPRKYAIHELHILFMSKPRLLDLVFCITWL